MIRRLDPAMGETANCVSVRPHQYLARAEEYQGRIYYLLDGWACRYRLLPDGRRQITGLFLPGDYCELSWMVRSNSMHPIVALTSVHAALLHCDEISRRQASDEGLRGRIWSDMLATNIQQYEWLTNLGRKSAVERLSHLFCEIFHRLNRSGLTYGNQCAMPLTQVDLADISGLTPVHVNRTLQDMRARGLIELRSRWLRIRDPGALKKMALFNDTYMEPR